jgi:hypothetical protein
LLVAVAVWFWLLFWLGFFQGGWREFVGKGLGGRGVSNARSYAIIIQEERVVTKYNTHLAPDLVVLERPLLGEARAERAPVLGRQAALC